MRSSSNVMQAPQLHARVQVPKVTLLDVYVLPTSILEVQPAGSQVHIRALDTVIEGSYHVEAFNCNDRFELGLHVHLQQEADSMCVFLWTQQPAHYPVPAHNLHCACSACIVLVRTACVNVCRHA